MPPTMPTMRRLCPTPASTGNLQRNWMPKAERKKKDSAPKTRRTLKNRTRCYATGRRNSTKRAKAVLQNPKPSTSKSLQKSRAHQEKRLMTRKLSQTTATPRIRLRRKPTTRKSLSRTLRQMPRQRLRRRITTTRKSSSKTLLQMPTPSHRQRMTTTRLSSKTHLESYNDSPFRPWTSVIIRVII